MEKHFSGIFSRPNHLSRNGPLILSFILTRHWGHHSQSEPSFQTNMHELGAGVLAGEAGRCVQARAKLPLGCAACLFVQITPNQGPQNWKAACRVPLCNPGLTWLCVVQTWREYGGVYSDMFSEKFSSNKKRKLLVKQLQADTLTGWEHASTHICPS